MKFKDNQQVWACIWTSQEGNIWVPGVIDMVPHREDYPKEVYANARYLVKFPDRRSMWMNPEGLLSEEDYAKATLAQ